VTSAEGSRPYREGEDDREEKKGAKGYAGQAERKKERREMGRGLGWCGGKEEQEDLPGRERAQVRLGFISKLVFPFY
jgi:hypothetical protein